MSWYPYRRSAAAALLIATASTAFAWNFSTADNDAVTTAKNTQVQARMASDTEGGAFIVWTDDRSAPWTNSGPGYYDLYMQHVDRYGRMVWTANGTLLCGASGDQTDVQAVEDGAGGAFIAWTDTRAGNADIYAQRINAAGTALWGANGLALCTASGNQESPRLVADGAGGIIVAWDDHSLVANRNIFAVRLDGTGAVMPGWTAGGTVVCNHAYTQYRVALAPDGAGGAVFAWRDYRNNAHFDIYAVRLTGSGTVAAGWIANGTALCQAAEDQDYPAVCTDAGGGAYVMWTDYRNHGSPWTTDLYGMHILGDGTLESGWSTNGTAIAAEPGVDDFNPRMLPDGSGGVFVAWDDGRNSGNIYVNRLTSSGASASGWPAGGKPACSAGAGQGSVNIYPDDEGGMLLAWSADPYQIYTPEARALRINPDGTTYPGWNSVDGTLVSTGYDKWAPQIVSDGAGGAIVCWLDERNGIESLETDIYASRVYSFGSLGLGGEIPGADLALWLKADAGVTQDINGVSAWADQSLRGNDAVQSDIARRPAYITNALNSRPAIRFDGIDDRLDLPSGTLPPGNRSYSIFAVCASSQTASSSRAMVASGDTGGNTANAVLFDRDISGQPTIRNEWGSSAISTGPGGFTPGAFAIVSILYDDAAGRKLFVHGGQLASNPTIGRNGNSGNEFIGAAHAGLGADTWNGDIAEILVYERAITIEERTRIENYFAIKYGIGLSTSQIAAIGAGQTGVFRLGNEGVAVNIISNTGGAGTITAAKHTTDPGGFIGWGGNVTTNDGSSIFPSYVPPDAWWTVEQNGLSGITYTISLDCSEVRASAPLDKLLLLKRPDSESDWTPYSTRRAGNILSISDLTEFSDFTAGSEQQLPVSISTWGAE